MKELEQIRKAKLMIAILENYEPLDIYERFLEEFDISEALEVIKHLMQSK